MPDGSNFDPSLSGLVQNPDGTWGAAQPAPATAVPTPQNTWANSETGAPAPADLPTVKAPLGDVPPAKRIGAAPVIDVGGKTNTDPNAQPGEAGSGFRPIRVGTKPGEGAALPSQAIPQETPPPPPPATPAAPAAPGGAIIPPPAQPVPAAPGAPASPLPQGAPPATQAPAPSASAKPIFHPSAAGLVQAPNGEWMSPAMAAAQPKPGVQPETPPPPPAAPGAQQGPADQPGQPPAPPPPGVMQQAQSAPPTTQAIPPEVANQEMREQPWYQGLHDWVQAKGGQAATFKHGLTLGYDEVVGPVPEAIARTVTNGKGFTQNYTDVQNEMRDYRQNYQLLHPNEATATEMAGEAVPALVGGEAYLPAKIGASGLRRFGTAAVNVGSSALQGAFAGYGMTDGDVWNRLDGAWQGFKWGAGLSAIPPIAREAWRAATPALQVERTAGETLAAQRGPAATATPKPAPIPNFPRGVGGAYQDPKLAALERQARELNDTEAVTQRTAQNKAITEAATDKVGGTQVTPGPLKPGSTQLASERMSAPDASGRVVEGMQNAWDVVKQEEGRLWQKPILEAKRLDLPQVKQTVDKVVANMPARLRGVIAGNKELAGALEDLANMPPDGKLLDLNKIRSDLLKLQKSLPREQATEKKVAGDLAQGILDGIEKNPELRNDPAAWKAYQQARAFTSRMWDTFGHDAFQRMLLANRYGNAGVDARTAASSVWGFTAKTAGERVPGGFDAIGNMLNDVRKQWGALRQAGITSPGMFNPATAQAAQAELLQGARDFIVNSMLDFATSSERDLAGEPGLILNRVSGFVDKNAGWMAKSGMFNPEQIELWKNIGEAARMGAAPDALRGGKGSPTYARLMRDPKFIDLLTNRFSHVVSSAIGGGAGYLWGGLGDVGIGALLGLGGEALPRTLMEAFYGPSNERVRQLVTEAIFDPELAHFLMSKANGQNARLATPKVQQWFRSWVGLTGVGEGSRIDSMPAQPAPAAGQASPAAAPPR